MGLVVPNQEDDESEARPDAVTSNVNDVQGEIDEGDQDYDWEHYEDEV